MCHHASCNKIFSLPQGKLSYFGIAPHDCVLDAPNTLLGLCYYTIFASLENGNTRIFNHAESMMMGLFFASFTTILYLACALTVLNKVRVLCWITHAISTTLVVYCVRRRSRYKPLNDKKTESISYVDTYIVISIFYCVCLEEAIFSEILKKIL